jgi:hypothetical protein
MTFRTSPAARSDSSTRFSPVVAVAARLACQANALAERSLGIDYRTEIASLDLKAYHVVARGARKGHVCGIILEVHALAIDKAQAEILIEQGDTLAHVIEHGLHESAIPPSRVAGRPALPLFRSALGARGRRGR